nr:aminopeptidase P family protein [Bacilli bacterium]
MHSRIQKIVGQFGELTIDAMLTFSFENRRYVTGFTGSSGFVLITDREVVLATDGRYVEQAKAQVNEVTVVEHQSRWMMTILEEAKRLGVKRIGFEADLVTYKTVEELKKVFAPLELIPVSGIIERVREIKEESELTIMRQAASIADQAFSHILGYLRPGLKETDVALELEVFMRKLGATGPSFDTIVASGPRSALPHGVASDRVIQSGEFVKMDYGCYYQGYASDITRTVVVGKPTDRHKEIYGVVLEAQLAGVAGMRAGLTGEQADSLARDVIVKAGYGEAFSHSLGHGLGLAVHEMPRVAQRSSDVLQEGMVVTIEPGIYLPGFGGVRIEDDVWLTGNTCERLTLSKKDLITVE